MMEILICGYGNIGKHVYDELKNLNSKWWNVNIYDKNNNFYKFTNIDRFYDYIIICVPTEMKEDGSADIKEVEASIKNIRGQTYVIRSAIPVGTADYLTEKYNANIVVVPEYWGTTKNCPNQEFMILGGLKDDRNKVCKLYDQVKNGYFKYIFTDHKTAELAKYMENCWIATKVTFCNEFADIAKKFDISYSELRECWIADKRVSPSHTLVYPEQPFYNSHCLNKDIPALIYMCEQEGIETPLIKAVKSIRDQKAKSLQI